MASRRLIEKFTYCCMMVRDVGAPSVQVTRIRHEIRRFSLILAIAVLSLGPMTSQANSQSTCAPATVRSGDVGEPGVTSPERAADVDSEAAPVRPPAVPLEGIWRNWPRTPGNGAHDGWTIDGAPIHSPDGRMCWPHGDHVHCR